MKVRYDRGRDLPQHFLQLLRRIQPEDETNSAEGPCVGGLGAWRSRTGTKRVTLRAKYAIESPGCWNWRTRS